MTEKSEITNTAALRREHLELARDARVPVSAVVPAGSIEAEEARGQAELVNSTKLPTDMRSPREDFEALGFVFGEPASGDPMFCEVTLPDGWAREGSSHSMWSYITDERGFRRVSIFYKAAFYDRSAFMSIVRDGETAAQSDTYEAFGDWCAHRDGWVVSQRKDGDNLVRTARRAEVDERGSKVYDHEAGDWKFTSALRERVVAPDGSIVSEREED